MNDTLDIFHSEKKLVRDFYQALEKAKPSESLSVLQTYCKEDVAIKAMHPFNEMAGCDALANLFWAPLKKSITSMQRRMDIFFAGRNEMDGQNSVWVCSMGHLMGLFDQSWLGIPATKKMVMLRYAEFHQIEDGKIAQTALFFDVPHLMAQAGIILFPEQTAAHMVQPGPRHHDGVLFGRQNQTESQDTLALINAMISDLGQWKSPLPLEEELAQTWHHDMLWWGPEGVGSTYTIERYAKQHSGPFRAAFSDRSQTKHLCRMAEGNFGGFFGWPNFSAKLTGPIMGREATNKIGEFRVIDIYRREGSKLAENWVYIDILHFWKSQGFDLLGCIAGHENMAWAPYRTMQFALDHEFDPIGVYQCI